MQAKYNFTAKFFLLLLLVLFLTGCATSPYTGRSQLMIMDEDQEMSLSAEAYKTVLEEEPIEKGTKRAKQVERVGQNIAAVADKAYVWEFITINRDDVINAMCLPGGKVFVYGGILKLVGDSDAELATVMAHEIAHAIARHGAESASVNQSVGLGASLLGIIADAALLMTTGESVSSFTGDALSASDLLGTAAALGLTLPHSRLQEEEADHIGLIIMAKAGYNPNTAIAFWQKMAGEKQGNEPLSFLSTHPLDSVRINNIQKQIPEVMPYYLEAKNKR